MKFRNLWVVCVALAGCHEQAVVEAAPEFPVGQPQVTSTWLDKEYVGRVEAVRYVEFRSRLKGFIEQVGVDEGQAVKQGQLLFTISARELAQELKKAKAGVESADAELQAAKVEQANTRVLAEGKIVSQAEVQLANAKVAQLHAKLTEAEAHEGQAAIHLSHAQVKAPFDGVVNRIPRKLGALVDEDELLTTLTDTHEVFIYFQLSEQEYLKATSGGGEHPRTCTFKLANGAVYPEPGVIDAVETEFDEKTGNIAFRARFPNPKGLLKHGATGKVVVRTELGRTLVVPQAATFEIQELLYVFTLDQEDRVRSRRITTRERLHETFVVDSGLQESDRVLLEGVHKVKDGDRVTVRAQVPPTSAL
ncbi:MAG: efflux RND transporter periplasmic adaptor subunit [Archangium sp.]|nr:efflux RND transporter periplasmic adaptor subunit [Archangium sp.]MDP3152277.1 efflux RND transporter periplasmic adaptor subunit [Archangium sp.]MDP3570673.1 efflux RND transporter periplasmic adaptor subunit [Archangium sp.]